MYGLLWFMNENEVISNIRWEPSNIALHKCIGKHILDVPIINLKLGNDICFPEAIELLIFLAIFGKCKTTMIKICY